MSEIMKVTQPVITENYKEAWELHRQIIANGETAASALVEMCRCLKRMRDTELYQELGYTAFEDYAEQAVGIKQRQAYKYISTYERLGDTVLTANATLGITKLELIASVPAEERVDFTEDNNLAGMSVKEIKAMVDDLTVKGEQLQLLQEELDEIKSSDVTKGTAKNDESQALVEKMNTEISSLKEEIQELKNKPADVAVIEPDEKTMESIRKEAEKEAKEKFKKDIEKAKLDATQREQSAKRDAEEKIKKLQAEKEQAEEQIKQIAAESAAATERAKKLEKELRLKSSASTTEVTVYFGQLQDSMNKIIQKVTEIKKEDMETGAKLAGAMARFLETALPVCRDLYENSGV